MSHKFHYEDNDEKNYNKNLEVTKKISKKTIQITKKVSHQE